MKTLVWTLFISFYSISAFAQPTSEQIIADSSFGWMKIYNYRGVKTTRTLEDRVFSTAQLSLCDSFSNWIQASYIPKGCIGDVRRVIGPKSNIYNSQVKYQPQYYGTTSYTWSLYMKNGKPTPIQETEIPWGITANEMPGNTITCLNYSGDNYFFMEEKSTFYAGTPKSVIDQLNIKTLPQFKNFHTLHSTSARYDRNAAIVEAVLLCKDNKLPFMSVTVEELMTKIELMINRSHQEALQSIKEKNSNDQKSIDYFSSYENENYKRAVKYFTLFKERYKNISSQQAMLPSGFDYVDFYNGMDIFTDIKLDEKPITAQKDLFPVYKLAANIKEQSKQDKPLWVRVTWNWDLQDERMKHMHESIINNFNFDYLYNFIFYPEKVKGIPYKPLHNPEAKTAVVVTEKSVNAKKAAGDPAVFYFEDFSSNATGQSPANWYSRINALGNKAKVVAVNGLDGKWLEVKGQTGIIPNNLTKPLPADVEISFDIAVPKDIPWGTKAFEFYMGSNEQKNGYGINFRFRAGFYGRPGELEINPSFVNGNFDGLKNSYDIPGFSNDKEINIVKVVIRKKENGMVLLFNGNTAVSFSKAFSAGTVIKWLEFSQLNSDSDTQKYYLSNFNIKKM